jgi:hypothetical protein
MTRPGKGRWRAPDLAGRDFPAAQINTKWCGDGTEIRTGEGKLHLASVLDMASRRILGFALGEHHDAQLAYGALAMAVAVRGGQMPGVIMHTDSETVGAGVFRVLTPTAMDTTGCWCRALPGGSAAQARRFSLGMRCRPGRDEGGWRCTTGVVLRDQC